MLRTFFLFGLVTAGAWSAPQKLPISFEINRGQAPDGAGFLARVSGHWVSLSGNRAELTSPGSHVAIILAGVSTSTKAEAEVPLPGVVNYLQGRDASRWLTGIPTYARVRYREVYPGIDLVYHGEEGRLEYDFIVTPGADPRRIRLRYEGTRGIHIGPSGDLLIETAAGSIRQHRPSIYQEADGVRREVAGRYVLRGAVARFELARYDHTRPLVIDPALTWATYFGSSADDSGEAVAVDSAGNIYIAGSTAPSGGYSSAFVSKLSPDGASVIYTTVLSGSYDSAAHGIAADSAGNAYVAGETDSPDFPYTAYYSSYYPPGYSEDAFIVKLDSSGKIVYANLLIGSGGQIGLGVAPDSANNAYLVGATNSQDFPVNAGQTKTGGGIDAFVTKFDASGKAIYSTYFGGNGDDYGYAIAVDGSGNAYLTGSTASTNFPATLSAYQPRIAGGLDAFAAKLSPTLTLAYSTYLGGGGDEFGAGIAIDSSGAAYITGQTSSSDFPTLNPIQKTIGGGSDIFVTKLSADGRSLAYSTFLGGNSDDYGYGIAVDGGGNAYVTGGSASPNFPVSDPFQSASHGSQNAVVAALNASGSALLFSSYLGGSGSADADYGNGVAVNCSSGLVVVGTTGSADFPATSGALRTSFQGGASDAFVAKIGAGGGTPAVATGGVVNSASSAAGPVAPGSLVTIYGSNMAVATETAPSAPWGINLGGAAVAMNGAAVPIYYASAGQMNVQAPYEVRPGTATVTVTAACGTSAPVTFQVAEAAPYIFQAGGGWAITYADGTLNGPNKPAHSGDVVVVYLTGIGPVDNPVPTGAAAPLTSLSWATLPNSATIGGWTARVRFLGLAPGFVGLAQANLEVPPGLSPGQYPIVITVGGVPSNAATLYVQ